MFRKKKGKNVSSLNNLPRDSKSYELRLKGMLN